MIQNNHTYSYTPLICAAAAAAAAAAIYMALEGGKGLQLVEEVLLLLHV